MESGKSLSYAISGCLGDMFAREQFVAGVSLITRNPKAQILGTCGRAVPERAWQIATGITTWAEEGREVSD